MTEGRVLVAVDDSSEGLEAARSAVDLAGRIGGRVRAVTVLVDHALDSALGGPDADAGPRLVRGRRSLLAWVADLAARAGVACETATLEGQPFRRILEDADAWGADLVVVGRPDRRGTLSSLGTVTLHVLEFSDLPVLVVPARRRPR